MKAMHPSILAYELNILILTAQSVDYNNNPTSALDDFNKLKCICTSSSSFENLSEKEKDELLFGIDAIKDILEELTQFRKRVQQQIEITDLAYQLRPEV